jgi:hypothetical protein
VRYDLETDFADLSDVALGEVRTYPLRFTIEGAREKPEVYLASSCDCLSASFTSLDAGGGEILVKVDGNKPEDIDGAITLEDADHRVLAEHVVRIVVTRKPFVSPPVTRLGPGDEEFVITAGYAFRPGDPDEGFDLLDLIFDESRFEMLDWKNEERLETDYRLKLMAWPMRRIGEFDEALDETITVVLENPDTRLEARILAKP